MNSCSLVVSCLLEFQNICPGLLVFTVSAFFWRTCCVCLSFPTFILCAWCFSYSILGRNSSGVLNVLSASCFCLGFSSSLLKVLCSHSFKIALGSSPSILITHRFELFRESQILEFPLLFIIFFVLVELFQFSHLSFKTFCPLLDPLYCWNFPQSLLTYYAFLFSFSVPQWVQL